MEGAVPVNGDDVVATATSGNLAVNVNTANLNSFDLNGYTGTLSGTSIIYVRPANGTTVNVRFAGTVTWTGNLWMDTRLNTDTGTIVNFYSGGKTLNNTYIGAGVFSPAANFTVNQRDNLTITNAFGLYAGTWTTNNYNVNAAFLYTSNGNSIVINAGSSTFTFTGNATYGYFYIPASNVTFNAGTSTINMTGAGNYNFYGAGLTYYNINRTGTAVGTDGIQFNGNLTIATGGTLTLAGNGGNGTTTNYRLLVSTTSIGTQSTITFTDAINVGTNLVTSYADYRDIAFNATADLSAITGGSGDAGGNSNITFTDATTQHWTNTNGGSWATVANWTSRVPLPQDTVLMDAAFGTSKTVTADMPRLGGSIDWSGATYTTALTWALTNNPSYNYGSLTFKNGMTESGTTYHYLSGRGSDTLTTNGATIGIYVLAVQKPTGTTLTLADSVTITNYFSIYSGTVDAATNNVSITAGGLSGSGGTLWLGSGTLSMQTVASTTFPAAIVLKSNATISIAAAKGLTLTGIISESGGAYSLTQSGAGQLTLSGNNSFSGGVTIKAGTVQLQTSANAGGTGAITIGDTSGTSNATLRGFSGGLTYANAITVASGSSGTLSISLGNAIFSGAITLSNDLTITATSGGGTISGAISGTGDITVNNTTSSGTTISNASIDFTGTITNSGTSTGTTTISGVIGSNVTGVVQNSATSQLTLSGNNSSFAGGVTIQNGTVSLTTSANAAGTGTITLGSGTNSNTVTLKGDGNTFGNAIALANISTYTGTINIGATGNSATFSGNITGTNNFNMINGYAGFTFSGSINNTGTVTSLADNVNISGVIGSNVTGVIQNSGRTLTLSNASNTFTGDVTNSAGTLNITQNNTFDTVTIAGDTTTNITAGKIITVTDFVSTGTSGHLAIWKSATSASHTLTTASAQISTDYLSLTYSQPTQTNTWYAGANSTDNGNNGNWIFTAPAGGGSISKVAGVADASIGKVAGVAKASIKKISGVADQ